MFDDAVQKLCPKTKYLAWLDNKVNVYRQRPGHNANQSGQHNRLKPFPVFGENGQPQTGHDSQTITGEFIQYFANFFHQQTGEIPSTLHEHAPSDVVK